MLQTLAFQINKVTYYFTTRLHIFRAIVKPSHITTMLLMLLLLCVPSLSVFLYYLQQMNQFSSIDSRCLLLSTFLLLSKASGDWIYIHLSLVEEEFLLHQPKKRDFLSKEIVYYIYLYNTLYDICALQSEKKSFLIVVNYLLGICNDCFMVEIIILQCTFVFIFSTLCNSSLNFRKQIMYLYGNKGLFGSAVWKHHSSKLEKWFGKLLPFQF